MELSTVQWSLLVLLLLGSWNPTVTVADEKAYKLVCYYTNWAIYRPSLAKYTPENINPYLCTHLIYAFGGLSTRYEIKPFDSYNDIQQGNYKKFVDLKRHNPKLKTMIAVGGWNEGSKKFSAMVSSSEHREKFVRSVMKFLRQHKFDGLDLDWEYPTFRDGSSPDDKDGYLELVKELREAFDNEKLRSGAERLLLTMAVPAGRQYIEQGYDIPALSKELDFFNLLTYDYYTTQEGSANHHSALFGVDDELESWDPKRLLNVDWTINFYLELGAPPNKLVVGVPTYGRAFKLEDPEDSALGALISGSADAGPSTREEGYLAYYEICKQIQDDDEWIVERPFPDEVGPYAYKGDQWVGYDDEEMVMQKAKYVVEHKLGGVMFWALDTDDFRGQCGGEKSPLITAARKVLLSSSVSRSKSTKSDITTKSPPKIRTTTTTTTTAAPETTTLEEIEEPHVDDEQIIDEELNIDEDVDVEEEPILAKKSKNRLNERSDQETSASCKSGSGRGRQSDDCETDEDLFSTPAPPTTPEPAPQMDCKDEGFFPNTKDCRKYFWCLDSGPADLGIVPHHFTCPSGLHFNTFTDSCDYPNNVNCKIKSPPTEAPTTTTRKPKSRTRAPARRRTTVRTTTPEEEEEEVTTEASTTTGSNPNIAQLLHLIEKLGGVEEVQKHLSSNPSSEDEDGVATTSRKTLVRTTAAPEVETTNAPFRRGSRTRTTTTTTKATTTTEKPQPSSSRPIAPRRRQRPKTTTTESATEESTRRMSAARTRSSTRSKQRENDEDVSGSTLKSTVIDVDDGEMEARIDAATAPPNAGSESSVGEGYETFGPTRIPGLFKYVPLRRQTSTEAAPLDITAQIRKVLDSSERKTRPIATGGSDDEAVNFDVTAKESTNNIQIASLDPIPEEALVRLSTTSSPPFENIGVRLEKEITSQNEGFIFDQDNEGTITEEQTELPSLEVQTVSEDITETEVLTSDSPQTTERPSTTEAIVPIRRVIMKTRQRQRKTTTSTTSPTSTREVLLEAIEVTRGTTAPTAARTTSTTTTTTSRPTTIRRIPSRQKYQSTTTRPPTPDPNDPLAIRVRFNHRPSTTNDDSFQGLAVKSNGDLDCIEQGVYPHPIECNKFVSCVFIQGSIRSWTYVCPNQQLYDDFTGRCLDEELVECQL